MTSKLTPLLVASALVLWICCSSLQIRNNGYEELVVAISDEISQDPDMIEQLKTMFKEASSFLHRATRSRAFIRNVTILIPLTWPDDGGYEAFGWETFENADFRVDPQINPLHGNAPYTRQIMGCGDAGQYIHLTPDFVMDADISREETWGPVGKVFVHEFAHLRYGVFDEYQYDTGDDIGFPQGCTVETSDNCGGMYGDYGDDCDPGNPQPKASIMYKQFLSSIDSFCESNSASAYLRHNANENTPQNKICSTKGTWDVISSHPDFVNGNNPTVELPDTSPIFKVVYQRPKYAEDGGEICRRLVLTMDISGSMKGTRIYRLRQLANKLIRDFLPLGTELGMVVFASSASVWQPMTHLNTDAIKTDMIDKLPRQEDVGGNTAIGEGVQKSIQLLQSHGESSEGSIIFLISDGRENVYPRIRAILDEVKSSGVIVYTVALSSAAENDLIKLSLLTDGEFYYESENVNSTSLEGSLAGKLADELRCLSAQKQPTVELTRHTTTLTKDKMKSSESVLVDPSIGSQTLFTFSFPEGADVEVVLDGPSGFFDKFSAEYSQDKKFNIIRYRIPKAEAGMWTYNMRSLGHLYTNQIAVVTAISYPNHDVQPIVAKAHMSQMVVSFGVQRAAIYAEVTKGYLPVVKADVLAIVNRPIGESVSVILFDDGQGADNFKDDGVYSAFFTEFNGDGKHSVDVTVSTNDQTSVVTAGSGTSGSARSTTGKPPPTILEPLDAFHRITSAGGFLVTDFVPDTDPYPPSRITDLRAEAYSYSEATVTLTWTAPGGDLDHGNASHYVLRRADTFDELRLSFNDSFPIDIGFVVPQLAKSQERVSIQIPYSISHLEKHIFAIRAFDDAFNSGEVSNLVFVARQSKSSHVAAIVAGIFGGLIASFLIALATVKLSRRSAASRAKVIANP